MFEFWVVVAMVVFCLLLPRKYDPAIQLRDWLRRKGY